MLLIKIIIVLILGYLIYTFLKKINPNKEYLNIPYADYIDDDIKEENGVNCEKREITDSDFFKKVYSSDEPEIIFY
jgi:hypothetical protein